MKVKVIKAHDDEPQWDEVEKTTPPVVHRVHVSYRGKIRAGYDLHWGQYAPGLRKLADGVTYIPEGRAIMLHFDDGTAKTISVDKIRELRGIPDEQLKQLAITFAGTALSLIDHDIDISVSGLLKAEAGSDGSGSSGSRYGEKGYWRHR